MTAASASLPLVWGLQAKDLITIVGLALSLGLGCWNFKTTRKIRRGTITLEEVRSQFRDPIQKKLDNLLELRRAFIALAKPNGLSLDELKSKVSDPVAGVEFGCLEIETLLSMADQSSFMVGTAWLSFFKAHLDKISEDAERLSSPHADLKSMGGGLAEIAISIHALDKDMRARLEKEVTLHLPR